MPTNESPAAEIIAAIIRRPPLTRAIDTLQKITDATIITHDDTADIDPAFDLPLAIADEFLLRFELCPIHRTHIEICLDDDLPECADMIHEFLNRR